MDPGESLEECCRREMWEETGLIVRVVRLIGIYATPHRVTYYADGHRRQTVSVTFLTAMTGGTLGLSDETTDVGFFSLDEMAQLPVFSAKYPPGHAPGKGLQSLVGAPLPGDVRGRSGH